MKLSARAAQLSSPGPKPGNDDALGLHLPQGNGLPACTLAAAIADGVSSVENGRIAAETSVTNFLNDFFALAGLPGLAEVRDVISRPPDEPADLALVLKTLPCLEAIDRRAPERLLDALQAPRLLVSFPAQTLGGRRKGMAAHYEAQFGRLLDARGWTARRFEFATELAFLVEKR